MRITSLALLAISLLTTGCTQTMSFKELGNLLPSAKQEAQDNRWSFYGEYVVTEGQGTVFTDKANTYIILKDGGQASTINPGEELVWVQKGAVIHVIGHPWKIDIVSKSGNKFKALQPGFREDGLDVTNNTETYPAKESISIAQESEIFNTVRGERGE